jgi:PAS domain S-box-containing protein
VLLRELSRRGAILEAVAYAAERLLKASRWIAAADPVLARLGHATAVSRVYVFENHWADDGRLLTSQRFEWAASGVAPQLDNPDLQHLPLETAGFGRWVRALGAGELIEGNVRDFPASERDLLEAQSIASILVVPIFVEGAWWGFIGFDACATEHAWSAAETDALKLAASTLGAAIERGRADEARTQLAREQAAHAAAEAAAAALAESEARLRAIVEAAPIGIALSDPDGRIVTANPAYQRLVGYSEAELRRMRWADLIAAENLPRQQALFHELVEGTRASYDIQTQYRRKDGEWRWGRLVASIARDATGAPICSVGMLEDITAAKRAEAERQVLLEREQTARRRLALLSQAGQRLASSLRYEATLTEVARLAVPAFGDACVVDLVQEDGSLQRLAEAHADPTQEPVLRKLRRFAPELPPSHPVLQVVRSGASALCSEFTDALRTALFHDPEQARLHRELGFTSYLVVPLVLHERVLGALSFFTTGPRQRFSEQDVPLAEELARRAARAIENARLHRQLHDLLEARHAFITAITHDLRGPLTGIKGYTQLLQRQLAREGALNVPVAKEQLATVMANVARLQAMVQELLDTQRLEMGELLALNREPTDLVALARRVLAECQIEDESRRLWLDAPAAELVGDWDGPRLERVLQNLLENARKYSSEGSAVVVTLRQVGHAAVLQVRDQGVGIPAQDLPHIFERFRRGANVRGQVPGTGLGLWGVHQIVQQHGGSVHVESQEGRGTNVTVRLPLDSRA